MPSSSKQSELQDRLREYLCGIRLAIGDRLPGEREIAAALGVGRTALRPALETLEAQGILLRKAQAGTFLAAIPSRAARSDVVALIAPFQGTDRETDPFWLHRVVSAFERAVHPSGIKLILKDQSPLAGNPCSLLDLAKEAAEDGARAAVLVHPLGTREKIAHALAILHDLGLQSVIASARTYSGLASQVYFDSSWGAYVATRMLVKQGHVRIGFAGAPGGHEWVRERVAAYRNALEAADIPARDGWIFIPNGGERLPHPSDGAEALASWLTLPASDQPTGVIAANDVVALGLLAAARERGIAIPASLSVVGFDNDAAALPAGLTTVDRPTEALGDALARVTLERLAAPGAEATAVSVRLRPVLIERATVGPPPHC